MEEKNDKNKWSMLGFAWNLGYSIAIPLILFTMGGHYLDKKFDTTPWFFLGGMAFSLVTTSVIVYKKVIRELNKTINNQ